MILLAILMSIGRSVDVPLSHCTTVVILVILFDMKWYSILNTK